MHSFLLVGSQPLPKIHALLEQYGLEVTNLATHPDIFYIPSQSTISIKTIRELKLWASRKPFQSPAKAVVIIDAHTATIPAQNALLKTLEEPPADTIIILTTPNQSLLLPTIISRCQVIVTKPYTLVASRSSEMESLLKSLPSLSPAKRLIKAGEYSKNRDSAIQTIEAILAIIRRPPNPHLRSAYAAHKHLKANVNPKLVLENLFLNW